MHAKTLLPMLLTLGLTVPAISPAGDTQAQQSQSQSSGSQSSQEQQSQGQPADQFKQADSDGDGKISEQEAQQAQIDQQTFSQADANSDGSISETEFPVVAQQMQQQGGGQLSSMTADDVKGKKVVNSRGDEIGEVEEVVQSKVDQSIALIVPVGGFLGIGEQKVALPLQQFQMQDDRLVYQTGISEDELKQSASYDEENYQPMEGSRQLSMGGQSGGSQQQVSFEQLDQDKDGNITQQEAQGHPQLAQNWQQYDANQDDKLDQSEFSAYEQQQQTQSQQGSGGGQLSFQQLDKDQDGNITRQEAQSQPQLSQNWQQYDKNRDDKLNQSEFSAFEQQQKQQKSQQSSSGGGGQVSFQQLDKDQDGSITKQEAQTQPQLSQNWQQYDKNSDGKLDQSEFSAFEQKQKQQQSSSGGSQQQSSSGSGQATFSQLDKDQDGSITSQEAQDHPLISQNMQQYDKNKDGKLDQSEFSALEQKLQKGQKQPSQ